MDTSAVFPETPFLFFLGSQTQLWMNLTDMILYKSSRCTFPLLSFLICQLSNKDSTDLEESGGHKTELREP